MSEHAYQSTHIPASISRHAYRSRHIAVRISVPPYQSTRITACMHACHGTHIGARTPGQAYQSTPCFPRAAVPVRWAVRGEASPRVKAGGLRLTEASRLHEESDPDDCHLSRRRLWRRNVRRGPDQPPAVGEMAHDPSLVHFMVFALTISPFLAAAREQDSSRVGPCIR